MTNLMRASNVSQSELAERAGLSQSILSRVINGKREFTADEVKKVARVLGVQPRVLVSTT